MKKTRIKNPGALSTLRRIITIYVIAPKLKQLTPILASICMPTKTQFNKLLLLSILALTFKTSAAQTYLGHNREEVLLSYAKCTAADKYDRMVVFNCNGQRSVFYFQGANALCDLYAAEMDQAAANDTLQAILKTGYQLLETRYVEPFLESKRNNHQKFPARVYSNGKTEYCFMPISLTGRTADLSTVIVRQPKK
jgi:hypothetical protein